MRLRCQRNAGGSRRVCRVVGIDLIFGERGVESGEQALRIRAFARAHPRDERCSRNTFQAQRVQIPLDHVGRSVASSQFGGNR
jgi:hypothetical protein